MFYSCPCLQLFLICFYSPSQSLIRILVTRCDIDLGNIKQEYEKKFGRSLQADVSVTRNKLARKFSFLFIFKTCQYYYFIFLCRATLQVITKTHFLLSSPEVTLKLNQKITVKRKSKPYYLIGCCAVYFLLL